MRVDMIALTVPATGTLEEFLEHCGRVCYASDSHGNPAPFIQARVSEGHESILEHAVASFEVSNVSRVLSHQLVRHRLASYSQESQRYVKVNEETAFINPMQITDNPEAFAVYDHALTVALNAYQQLLDLGISKENARYILPEATSTRIIVTMNFRELRHFFTMRITEKAQREIRVLGIAMLCYLNHYAAAVFGDIYRIKKSFFKDDFAMVEGDNKENTDENR